MKKVLHCVSNLDNGGITNFIIEFISKSKNYEHSICVLGTKKTYEVEEFTKRKVKIFYIKSFTESPLLLIYQLFKLQHKYNFDIMHIHRSVQTVYLLIIAKIIGFKKIFLQPHSPIGLNNWFLRYLSLIFANKVIGISKNLILKIYGNHYLTHKKISYIYCGIDFEKFDINISKNEARQKLNWEVDKIIISFIGRLTYQKNPLFFIEIAKKINEISKSVIFKIIGNGPLFDKCISLINSYKLNDHVHLIGFRKDIPLILKATDLLIIPSIYEGLPLLAMEASAARVPYITSDYGAFVEVLGETAKKYSFSLDESIDKLARKIIDLINNYDELNKIIIENYDLSKKFDINRTIQQIISLYEE